jgi:ribose 5-phosphate isomerase B
VTGEDGDASVGSPRTGATLPQALASSLRCAARSSLRLPRSMKIDVGEIARRAAGKALAELGRTEHGHAHPARAAAAGVHVEVTPSEPAKRQASPANRELITVDSLRKTPDGGVFEVVDAALVTPLAEEEAHRRNVRLVRAGSSGRLRVAVGCDHGGFKLKQDLLAWIGEAGHAPVDFGTRDENAVDYPDFARAVAEAVASGQCDIGVVVDGAGIGSAIAANKVPGVRAATCCDVAMAKNAREHNFANVLSLGAKMLTRSAAHDILRAFLTTPFGEERHGRRVAKITAIEQRYSKSNGSVRA